MFYHEDMDSIGIRELNQHTSQYVSRVKAGETIGITERGRLVARLAPVSAAATALAELVATGQAQPPTVDPRFLVLLPPTGNDGVNVADLLIASREEERF